MRALPLACVLSLMACLALAPSAFAQRKVEVAFSCTSVVYTYTGFPEGKEVTASETVRGNGGILLREKVTFKGPEYSNTLKIALTPGHHILRGESGWKNGESGTHHARVDCAAPKPELSVNKLQAIAGSEKPFTALELTGRTGQTVEYEIRVANIGNVPLVLSKFSDPGCEAETIAGGQGETPLAPAAQTIYTCSRKLSESGEYKNVAYVTAIPEEGGGSPLQGTSNAVITKVPPKLSFEVTKLQEIAGTSSGYTTAEVTGTVGQSDDYEIVVKNTGNVAITLSEFADVNCEPATISGGPGTGAIAPGASSTYTCARKFTEVTTSSTLVENVAQVTATAVGTTEKDFKVTNTVKAKVDAAPTPAGGSSTPTGTTGGGSGTLGTSTGATGKPAGGGVLSTKTAKKKHRRKARSTTTHRTPRFTG